MILQAVGGLQEAEVEAKSQQEQLMYSACLCQNLNVNIAMKWFIFTIQQGLHSTIYLCNPYMSHASAV